MHIGGTGMRGLAGDFRGGLSSAFVSLGVLLPLGLLSFAAMGPEAGTVGVRAAFATAIVGSLVAAIVGGADIPGSGPKTSTSVIFAGYVAVLVTDPRLHSAHGIDVESLVLLTSLCVAVAGLLQVAFAWLRLGALVSFVPLPVVAGFMDGVAILIAIAQFETLFGVPFRAGASGLAAWSGQVRYGGLALGVATAALCWIAARRWPRMPWALLGILAGTAMYAVAARAFPEASLGPLLGGASMGLPVPDALAPLATPGMLSLVRAHLPNLLTTAVVIALIGSMDALLSAVAVDTRLDKRHEPNRVLLGLGLGNLACAAFGGVPVATSSVVQLATHRAGGHSRTAGLVCALVLLVMLLVAGDALHLIPLTVLAGVMLVLALGMFDQWIRAPWRQIRAGSRDRDALWSLGIVAVVCVITVVFGFVVAIAVGVVLSVVLFVMALNRSLVRNVATGETRGSRRIYDPERARVLRERGAQIRVIELEGAIFFGTARRLGPEMEALATGARLVIMDVRRVTMIDASGATALDRLASRLAVGGARLLLAGMVEGHRHARALRAYGAFAREGSRHWYPDVDRALEAAERALLDEAGAQLPRDELPLEGLALLEGVDGAQRERLRSMLTRVELAANEVLFRRGEPGDRLYVIARGSISILADVDEGVMSAHRLASFGPGVVFGETAMLDRGVRSAGAAADEPSVLYALTRADFDTLREREPALANIVLLNIARELSARLRFATATIQAGDR